MQGAPDLALIASQGGFQSQLGDRFPLRVDKTASDG